MRFMIAHLKIGGVETLATLLGSPGPGKRVREQAEPDPEHPDVLADRDTQPAWPDRPWGVQRRRPGVHRHEAKRTTLCLETLDEQAGGGPASMRRNHAGECTGGGSGAAGLGRRRRRTRSDN